MKSVTWEETVDPAEIKNWPRDGENIERNESDVRTAILAARPWLMQRRTFIGGHESLRKRTQGFLIFKTY